MVNKRIIISVSNDLETDQRVNKIATWFHEAGFDVLVIGRKHKESKILSRLYRTKRFKLLFNKSFLFYAEYNIRLFLFLLFTPKSILWANDTDTILPNYLVSKLFNRVLFFDAHELFPELPELVHRKRIKKVWKTIEDMVFPKLQNSFTVCQSIADYYQKMYGIKMEVIRNVPYKKDMNSYLPISVPQDKVIVLYQGAVNVGRGLEQSIEAMALLPNAILYIIGDGDVLEKLKNQVNKMGLHQQVIFTGRIPFEQLPRYTKVAHVGLALLENRGLSYYYALPNRIFDFIHAEVPILATDFPEMAKIINTYNVGKTIQNNTPSDIANGIMAIYNQNLQLSSYNKDGFKQAKEQLCWEYEQNVLSKAITKISQA